MSKADAPKLNCTSCGHDNEPERVYCHNCGSKLDRTLLPKAEAAKTETPEETHKRVRRMMTPRRSGGFSDFRVGAQMVLFAMIVAALFLFWQKPEGVPDTSKVLLPETDPSLRWEQLMGEKTAKSFTVTEDDLNGHLKSILKANQSTLGMKFSRAVVSLQPGMVSIFVERDLFGLSLYTSANYKISNTPGKVTLRSSASALVGSQYIRLLPSLSKITRSRASGRHLKKNSSKPNASRKSMSRKAASRLSRSLSKCRSFASVFYFS
jgi:hypothetical protein